MRALIAIALVAATAAALSITVLAWSAIGTQRDLDRVVEKADRVADDAAVAVRRLDRSSRELGPAVRELRSAARDLSDTGTTP